jgi:hypothetical protein
MRTVEYSRNQAPSAHVLGSTAEFRARAREGAALRALAQYVPSTSYTPVQPNRTTKPFGSWPCERLSAEIDNKTSLAILHGQYDEVCARLMQATKNHKLFKRWALTEGVLLVLNLLLLTIIQTRSGAVRSGVLASAALMSVCPHFGVARQFHRIQQRCESALRSRFGDSFLQEMEGLTRNEHGFRKLIELLGREGCSTDFLQQKLDELHMQTEGERWAAECLSSLTV